MSDPKKNPRDDEFQRRLQEEQSEIDDLDDTSKPRPDNLKENEPDTSPENT
jgi:hypothetical protein